MSPGLQSNMGSGSTSSPLARFFSNLLQAEASTVAAMALNFFSSTCIVVTNKLVMDKYNFRYAVSLTCYHLTCTFLMLLLTSRLGLFEVKRLPLEQVAKLAAGTMGFICLTNLSLMHNSVGFYQVMKVMTTPTVVVIESLLYQKYLPTQLKISLIPVCLGVILTTVTEVKLNLPGTMYAVAGVIVTSFYQIWGGSLQKSLDCNALQLQTYVAPLAALFIVPFMPLLDSWRLGDPKSIWNYDFQFESAMFILATGFVAFLVNVSIFLVIGKSSALSYNILGHAKTMVVLMSDFVLFGRPKTIKSTMGIFVTMVGVFWYTSLKLERARVEKEARERNATTNIDVKVDNVMTEKNDLIANGGDREE